VVINTEMSREFSLPYTTLTAMVSGETVSVARKHQKPITVEFNAPQSYAGNR
jgi:hypothetical protein